MEVELFEFHSDFHNTKMYFCSTKRLVVISSQNFKKRKPDNVLRVISLNWPYIIYLLVFLICAYIFLEDTKFKNKYVI